MRPLPPCAASPRRLQADGLVVHLVVSIGASPMIELTVARVLVILLDELQVDHVPVRRVELRIDGPLPERVTD